MNNNSQKKRENKLDDKKRKKKVGLNLAELLNADDEVKDILKSRKR